MIEVLTTKSGEITTSNYRSTILAEHTTVIDSTSSTSQLIDTNNETLVQCDGINTTLTSAENGMILSLKDKPTNNERTQISSIEKDSIILEEKRVNISNISTAVIPTNNHGSSLPPQGR